MVVLAKIVLAMDHYLLRAIVGKGQTSLCPIWDLLARSHRRDYESLDTFSSWAPYDGGWDDSPGGSLRKSHSPFACSILLLTASSSTLLSLVSLVSLILTEYSALASTYPLIPLLSLQTATSARLDVKELCQVLCRARERTVYTSLSMQRK